MKKTDSPRFQVIHEETHSLTDIVRILRDTVTGVHYLQTRSSNAGGLTFLLGENGQPVRS